jgi:hypothetical protein
VAHVHAIGRVETGARLTVTFDSDFDAQAGVTITDLAAQRGTFVLDDDSGGNLDPQLNITASQAGTLVLFVAGTGGSSGCYHYRIEATSLPLPAPAPTPGPTPQPQPQPQPQPGGGVKTYKSAWLNASWIGGRTGSPSNVKADYPAAWSGYLCGGSSLRLENHNPAFENIWFGSTQSLLIINNCGRRIDSIMACVTAGSGGGGPFPTCDVDPRTTPLGRLRDLGGLGTSAGASGFGNLYGTLSPVNLDLNLFWCGDGAVFTNGTVPGLKVTDCVVK